MAFLEMRKVNFFDLKKDIDENKIASSLQDCQITAITSGNSYLVFCDSTGNIYLISRKFEVSKFQAYGIKVCLAQQVEHSPLLVTVGEDDAGTNPVLKIWYANLESKTILTRMRSCRLVPQNKNTVVKVLCALDNLIAVGFSDGSIILQRGDIRRDRGIKQKILVDSVTSVTGLFFRITGFHTHLFASTESSIFVYDITSKDKEEKVLLDSCGCSLGCSVLSKSIQDSLFMVGRKDAVYCYTSDGRGPCFVVDNDKDSLTWFRNYLIIVSKSTSKDDTAQIEVTHTVSILDIEKRFMIFSMKMKKIIGIISEWGACYILDCDLALHHLDEKDLDSKLSLLFKKNLYDVYIRIAKSQQHDADGLVDVFRRYGDHLYTKGDHMGAINQYVKTIGKLEPSYVIRKFLDSQHIEKLIIYLQAVHRKRLASKEHTTLLLNCYTKLNQKERLEEFVMAKDRDLDFDVAVAIKVCRHISTGVALMLAEKHGMHSWYLTIQVEDNARYQDALEYISRLEFKDAEHFMKKYGDVLVEHEPDATADILKLLCTEYTPKNQSTAQMESSMHISRRAEPDSFIHLLVNRSDKMVDFLKYVMKNRVLSSTACDTLLDHYLYLIASLKDGTEKDQCAQSVLELLKNPDFMYDKSQAMVLCHLHRYADGIIYLYEEEKQYQEILRYHIESGDSSNVIATCRKFGHQDPSLWVYALWACVTEKKLSKDVLPEVLTVISREKLMSPLMVMDAVKLGSGGITLGDARDYLNRELRRELDAAVADAKLVEKYKADTEKARAQIHTMRTETLLFQGSRCAACHLQLSLPSVHFLCLHSFHQHCFQRFFESDTECPVCQVENRTMTEQLKARDLGRNVDEAFHDQLEHAADGFSLTAEYIARGVFNQPAVVLEPSPKRIAPQEVAPAPAAPEPKREPKWEPKKEPQKEFQKESQKAVEKQAYDPAKDPFAEDFNDDHFDETGYDKRLNPFEEQDF